MASGPESQTVEFLVGSIKRLNPYLTEYGPAYKNDAIRALNTYWREAVDGNEAEALYALLKKTFPGKEWWKPNEPKLIEIVRAIEQRQDPAPAAPTAALSESPDAVSGTTTQNPNTTVAGAIEIGERLAPEAPDAGMTRAGTPGRSRERKKPEKPLEPEATAIPHAPLTSEGPGDGDILN